MYCFYLLGKPCLGCENAYCHKTVSGNLEHNFETRQNILDYSSYFIEDEVAMQYYGKINIDNLHNTAICMIYGLQNCYRIQYSGCF